jgi:hypothetical protein
LVARWEQYEIWSLTGSRWDLVGTFMDLGVASAVARCRTECFRVIRAVFEDSKRVEEEILVDIGATRKAG